MILICLVGSETGMPISWNRRTILPGVAFGKLHALAPTRFRFVRWMSLSNLLSRSRLL